MECMVEISARKRSSEQSGIEKVGYDSNCFPKLQSGAEDQ